MKSKKLQSPQPISRNLSPFFMNFRKILLAMFLSKTEKLSFLSCHAWSFTIVIVQIFCCGGTSAECAILSSQLQTLRLCIARSSPGKFYKPCVRNLLFLNAIFFPAALRGCCRILAYVYMEICCPMRLCRFHTGRHNMAGGVCYFLSSRQEKHCINFRHRRFFPFAAVFHPLFLLLRPS